MSASYLPSTRYTPVPYHRPNLPILSYMTIHLLRPMTIALTPTKAMWSWDFISTPEATPVARHPLVALVTVNAVAIIRNTKPSYSRHEHWILTHGLYLFYFGRYDGRLFYLGSFSLIFCNNCYLEYFLALVFLRLPDLFWILDTWFRHSFCTFHFLFSLQLNVLLYGTYNCVCVGGVGW